jgi:heptosyltransferase-2
MSNVEIVLRLNAMGDILLTVPTLRALAANDTEVHLVINERWKALAEFLPAKVHYYDGATSLIHLANELKRLRSEALFDLQGKLSTIALRTMVNSPITRVYQKRTVGEQLQAIGHKYPLRFSDSRPVWQKYAETCGVTIDKPDASLNLSNDYLKECRDVLNSFNLKEKTFIVIHPEASKVGKVMMPELVNAIQKASPIPTVLVGTGNTKFSCTTPHIDLRNKFSLRLLPGVLNLASAVISSDSGPMHLARAVNTPLVAIFLQTAPSLGFSPIPSDDTLVISEDLPCKPCSLHGQNDNCPEGHFKCRQIDIELTLSKIFEFLKEKI